MTDTHTATTGHYNCTCALGWCKQRTPYDASNVTWTTVTANTADFDAAMTRIQDTIASTAGHPATWINSNE